VRKNFKHQLELSANNSGSRIKRVLPMIRGRATTGGSTIKLPSKVDLVEGKVVVISAEAQVARGTRLIRDTILINRQTESKDS